MRKTNCCYVPSLATLVFMLLCCGCKEKEGHVDWSFSFSKDGKIVEGNYTSDPKPDKLIRTEQWSGVLTRYATSGIKASESGWKEGKKHGRAFFWTETGYPFSEQYFNEGQRHGTWKSFYDDGTTNLIISYTNGMRTGLCEAWYQNGQLKEQVFFSNNMPITAWKKWDKEGKLIKETSPEPKQPQPKEDEAEAEADGK